MADFKRFTGFIAPDGTTHETLAKVKQHVLKLKIEEAAEKFAKLAFENALNSLANEHRVGFSDMNPGAGDYIPGIADAEDLTAFLIEHQAAIQAIYAQSVRERAVPKKKAVAPSAE